MFLGQYVSIKFSVTLFLDYSLVSISVTVLFLQKTCASQLSALTLKYNIAQYKLTGCLHAKVSSTLLCITFCTAGNTKLLRSKVYVDSFPGLPVFLLRFAFHGSRRAAASMYYTECKLKKKKKPQKHGRPGNDAKVFVLLPLRRTDP